MPNGPRADHRPAMRRHPGQGRTTHFSAPTGVGSVPVLGPEDLSQDDIARIMSEVLGTPVRYERQSLEDLGAKLADYRMADAFVQGMVDMIRAKDEGLDDGVQRTPETAGPTTFRQWCEEVLKPAVLA
jgi:uncharacterized protein YbjT (DUF2867 family)